MNPAASKHLSKVDRALARVIRQVGPVTVTPPRGVSPYMSLVRAVAHQQLTGKAANTILGRVLALYPGKKFPDPEDLLRTPDRTLRAAGFSWAKVRSVKDIAAKTIAGVVPPSRTLTRMTDEEIVERLTEVRGVGRWTVEMLLIFTLGRPDVWPVADFGVRKGLSLVYKLKALPTPKQAEEYGERWRPHRSAAAWYLWRACDLKAGGK
jgi:DNA-3-methyladenine glycosylase II